MLFYLGTHEPGWLSRVTVPLFVSTRRLRRYTNMPKATCRWALDSGGFSELSMYGAWETSPKVYAAEVIRYSEEVGNLDWAAIQDWMCEPEILKKTGLKIKDHQERTIDSLLELRSIVPDIHWLPVLQGWEQKDYYSHIEMYRTRGIDLLQEPVVGIGSVCRRQDTQEAEDLIRSLVNYGIKVHAFGFKVRGLIRVNGLLYSSDSMAWSYNARKNPPLPECSHKRCNNCIKWALSWRERLLAKLAKEKNSFAGQNQREFSWFLEELSEKG